MGLDMYLRAKLYVSGYKHSGPNENGTYRTLIAAAGLERAADPDSPHAEIEVCVAYWRKANAIHRWFVEKVQEGKDDCDEYYVSREQLEDLRETCRRALAAAEVAHGQPVHAGTSYRPNAEPEQHFEMGRAALNGEALADILPTQPGFFFGATDYDEWYLRSLEQTVTAIDRVLAALPERAALYYKSSW